MTATRSVGQLYLNENEDATLPVFLDASVSGTVECTMVRCKTCPGIIVDDEQIHFENWAVKDTGSIYKPGFDKISFRAYVMYYCVLNVHFCRFIVDS